MNADCICVSPLCGSGGYRNVGQQNGDQIASWEACLLRFEKHMPTADEFANALSFLVRLGGVFNFTTPKSGCKNGDLLAKSNVRSPEHLIYFGKWQVEDFLRVAAFKVLCFVSVLKKFSIRMFALKIRAESGHGVAG